MSDLLPIPVEASEIESTPLSSIVTRAREWLEVDHPLEDFQEAGARLEAIKVYVEKSQGIVRELHDLTELIVRNKRRIGQLLGKMPKHPGARKSSSPGPRAPREPEPPKLEETGLSRREIVDAHKLAAVPEDDFELAVANGKAGGRVSTAQVIRDASPEPEPDKLANLKPRHRIVEGHFIGMEWDLGLETTIKKANVKAHEAGQTLGDWLRQLVDEAVKQSNPMADVARSHDCSFANVITGSRAPTQPGTPQGESGEGRPTQGAP